MDANKGEVMAMMNCAMGDDFKISTTGLNASMQTNSVGGSGDFVGGLTSGGADVFNGFQAGATSYTPMDNTVTLGWSYPNGITGWDYWQRYYYPYVIKESYPVYIQEKAIDKGKQAFELIKGLMDKKFIKLDKVSDFVELMDFFIKTL
jgi:hypothetical protein